MSCSTAPLAAVALLANSQLSVLQYDILLLAAVYLDQCFMCLRVSYIQQRTLSTWSTYLYV